MVDACARPASVSPRPRPARCTSARPWWRSPTPWALAVSEASCCCASTTRMRRARSRRPSRGSSTTSPGSAWRSRARPCARASGTSSTSPPRASCSPRGMRIAASAHRRRSATTGAAGRSRAASRSAATRRASRTSCASASRAPRSSWRTRRAGRCASRVTRSRTSCSCGPTDGRRSISPPPWTTAISRSRTSCAARITSRTRRAICSCCARWARSSRSSRTARSSSARTASGSRPGAAPSRSRRCAPAACRRRPWSRTPLSSPARRREAPSEVASLEELAGRFSLARLGRGTAHADPAHLAWLGREVLAALPLDELAGRLAAFLPADTPEPVLHALAEAARGASSLGEVANSAAELAQRPSGPPPPGPALELFRELREADARAQLPYAAAVRARRSAARARREPRPLGPRRATPSENRPHGRAARPAASGRGRGAAA